MNIYLDIIAPLCVILGLFGLILILVGAKESEEAIAIYEKKWQDLKRRREAFQKKFFKELGEKGHKFFLSSSEKTLVRLRIIILRLDRSLFNNLSYLRKIKLQQQEHKNKIFEADSPKENPLIEGSRDFTFSQNLVLEEKKLLRKLPKKEKDVFQNLARLYLFEEDYHSARWIILEAYRNFPEDKIIRSFLVEIFEKENYYKSDQKKPAETDK
ncbi:MAG TPA: hypothetical protein PLQ27_01720 [Candidatus Paceibacterota bacterium]|nr:hypothetical protein [Candidatus Paceibacterota bacterium]